MKNLFAILFILLGISFIGNAQHVKAESGSISDDSSFEDDSQNNEEEVSSSSGSSDDSQDDMSDDSGVDSASDMDDSDEDESDDSSLKRPRRDMIRNNKPIFIEKAREERPTVLDNLKEKREGSMSSEKASMGNGKKIFDMSSEEGVRAKGLVKMRFTTAITNLERMSVRVESAINKISESGKDTTTIKSSFETAKSAIEEARNQVEDFTSIIEVDTTTPDEAKKEAEEAKASLEKARDLLKDTVDQIKEIVGEDEGSSN